MRWLLMSILLLSSSVSAGSLMCEQINCDCASISDNTWRLQCHQNEIHVIKNCNAGISTADNVCALGGVNALPSGLSKELFIRALPPRQNKRSIEGVVRSFEQQARLILEEQVVLHTLVELNMYGAAVDAFNRQHQAISQSYALYLSALADMKEQKHHSDADRLGRMWHNHYANLPAQMVEDANDLWAKMDQQTNNDVKMSQKMMSQMLLRGAGNILEYSADVHMTLGEPQAALALWLKSAELTSQLVANKIEAGDRLSHIEFYQRREASRWQKASVVALRSNDAVRAQMAWARVQELRGLHARAFADI